MEPRKYGEKITTIEEAHAIATAARRCQMPGIASPKQRRISVGVNTNFSGGNPHRNGHFHTGETPTTRHTGETPTTIDISGRGAEATNLQPSVDQERKRGRKSEIGTSATEYGSAGKLVWSTPELIEVSLKGSRALAKPRESVRA